MSASGSSGMKIISPPRLRGEERRRQFSCHGLDNHLTMRNIPHLSKEHVEAIKDEKLVFIHNPREEITRRQRAHVPLALAGLISFGLSVVLGSIQPLLEQFPRTFLCMFFGGAIALVAGIIGWKQEGVDLIPGKPFVRWKAMSWKEFEQAFFISPTLKIQVIDEKALGIPKSKLQVHYLESDVRKVNPSCFLEITHFPGNGSAERRYLGEWE